MKRLWLALLLCAVGAATWVAAIFLSTPDGSGGTLFFEKSSAVGPGVVLNRSDLAPLGLDRLFDEAAQHGKASQDLDQATLEAAMRLFRWPDGNPSSTLTVEGVRLRFYYALP